MAKNNRNGNDDKKSPCWSKRVFTGSGTVEVSVWDKMIEAENGEFRVFNIVAKRTWKEDDEYKSGNSFRPEDCLWVALFMQEAASFVANENGRK